MKKRGVKMGKKDSRKLIFPFRELFTLEKTNNIILFPLFLGLLSRLPYLTFPEHSFLYFIGSVVFWYVFAEMSFKKSPYFPLHRTYRYTVFAIVSFGCFVNAFIPSLLPGEFAIVSIPIFLGVSTITILIGYEEGISTGLFMAFLATENIGTLDLRSLETFAIIAVLAVTSAVTTRRMTRRINIAKAGFETGFIFAAILIAKSLIEGELHPLQILIGFINPMVSSGVLIGLLPYMEYVSRIYSDVGLLELGNLSHPLLKSLSISAPGTYYHSVNLANLAEAAAEKIGVNPILARVASYFHDIGKMKRPQYFTENQTLNNPHDNLAPSMSNLIINEHVKYGTELAKKYRLPLLVEDILIEHHGTRTKKYFYHKAKSANESENLEEFKYPGPTPRFKESGIIMLADSVEAAFKSIKDPTPSKIQELVEDIVNGIYNERQLDKSGLSLDDLEKIIQAFTRVLTSMNQPRVAYPKETTEKVVTFNGSNDTEQDRENGTSEQAR